jgi:hypothetical protein
VIQVKGLKSEELKASSFKNLKSLFPSGSFVEALYSLCSFYRRREGGEAAMFWGG